ncbi:MAG: S8 family serine peptidase [Planctomycetota bacterium]
MRNPSTPALTTACVLALACAAAIGQAPRSSASSSPNATAAGSFVKLRFATFDPLTGSPAVPELLQSTAAQSLQIVQFHGTPSELGRTALQELGGKIVGYLPDNAYVVRMPAAQQQAVRALPMVRWLGSYHPAYRLEPALQHAEVLSGTQPVHYNLVVADKHTDKPGLMAKIRAMGAVIEHEQTGSLLLEASLTGPQLQKVAGFDEVLWIDRWSPPELDMDNARIQGGGNYVEAQVGYTGTGIGAHIYEGIEASHQDFTGGAVNVNSGGASSGHGHATAGIVFGNGNSNPAVRGMAPDATKFYTNNGSVTTSRWQVFNDLINIHDCSHTTASWGNARTFFYTSISAESDDITFDNDITWTQSQSNAGNQDSRPQAWAKNVFSCGGVNHANNSSAADDSWQNGGASIGPASDGRLKPTLCAYYDNIGTSAVGGGFSNSFGGTSGATPIVAGHNVLAIQMFTDDSATPGVGPFGNVLRAPGSGAHANRPHAPTLKALQVVSANQYAFTAASSDNRREHQGFGFPNLQNMWDRRAETFIVDETDVLPQGGASRWEVTVAAGEPSLKICLNWLEPAANPAAAAHLINDLSLRVTSPSGVVYWGNNGLEDGVWSVVGGSEDSVNSLECVFVDAPESGVWNVDIKGTSIVVDNHVETAAVDADYSLVVVGGDGQPGIPPAFASFAAFGQGCPGSVPLSAFCAELNTNGGTLTNSTNGFEYTYEVPSIGSAQVTGFEVYTASNNGSSITRPAHIYAQVGGVPDSTPLASVTMTVGTTPGFYTATFATPVAVNGTFYIGYENSPDGIISNLSSGQSGTGYFRTVGNNSWSQSGLVQRPSYRVSCTGGPNFAVPALSNAGEPILGASYDLTLSDALANTFAVLASGLSDTSWSGGALPTPLPGAPGCDLLVAPDVLDAVVTSATGTGSQSIAVPSSTGLIGTELFHQWAILDAVNAAGLVLSNAGRATIGN